MRLTGRDGTGRDGTGRDGTGRDGTGRDGTGRDGTGRDGTGRDGTGRDGTGRDGKGREGKGREGKGREGKGREGNGRAVYIQQPTISNNQAGHAVNTQPTMCHCGLRRAYMGSSNIHVVAAGVCTSGRYATPERTAPSIGQIVMNCWTFTNITMHVMCWGQSQSVLSVS